MKSMAFSYRQFEQVLVKEYLFRLPESHTSSLTLGFQARLMNLNLRKKIVMITDLKDSFIMNTTDGLNMPMFLKKNQITLKLLEFFKILKKK